MGGGPVLSREGAAMIDGARQYVGRRLIWQGQEIEITSCFSCYEGEYFVYVFSGDADRKPHKISIFDRAFMEALP